MILTGKCFSGSEYKNLNGFVSTLANQMSLVLLSIDLEIFSADSNQEVNSFELLCRLLTLFVSMLKSLKNAETKSISQCRTDKPLQHPYRGHLIRSMRKC